MFRKTRISPRGRLGLLLVCAALLLSGCGQAPEKTNEPTAVPVAAKTADPRLSGNFQELENKLLAGAANALRLEQLALTENSTITSVRVPDQVLNQFLDALADEAAWKHAAGRYTLSVTSGGDYVYEKPYSELITGSSTDVYTIEDADGWVEEIVDNTRYDPFTWVMSGEGGGEFAYMTVYDLSEDAGDGTIETVSRLNGGVSGWSYDSFAVRDGVYRFLDLQLSPDEEGQIKTPYSWILCVGEIGRDEARIEEIGLQTQELALPADGLTLAGSSDSLFRQAEALGTTRTMLTLKNGSVSYTEYTQGK